MKINYNILGIFVIFIGICLIIGLSSTFFIQTYDRKTNSTDNIKHLPSEIIIKNIKTPSRNIAINATVREFSSSIPLYRATIREGDAFYKHLGDTMHTKQNVTYEAEAPDVAKMVMAQYGGLPADAEFIWSDTEYSYTQANTGEILSKEPIMTSAVYGRQANGLSFDGDTDYIRVELGENGQPLEIRKLWRNLTSLKNVSIIPASVVVEQLKDNETLDKDQALAGMEWRLPNITIDTIVLRYYEIEGSDTYVEPVWVCNGDIRFYDDPWKDYISFALNARHFASFTSDKSSVSTGEPVTFIDNSQTNAVKWLWEFGDGVNSTLRNPTHAYMEKGIYSVNLTVWNHFGKDNLSKERYITVSSGPIVNNPSSSIETKHSLEIKTEP
jgi:hypothetical protein